MDRKDKVAVWVKNGCIPSGNKTAWKIHEFPTQTMSNLHLVQGFSSQPRLITGEYSKNDMGQQ